MQPQTQSKIIIYWLCLCLFLTISLMVTSGIMRLHEAGHSLSEWHPVGSLIPQLPNTTTAYNAYKDLPQFQKYFAGMEEEDFKPIYLMEYAYYAQAYLLVLLTLIPFLWFASSRMLSEHDALKLAVVFVLGSTYYIAHCVILANAYLDNLHMLPYCVSLERDLQFTFLGFLLWYLLSFSYPKQDTSGFELPTPTRAVKIFSCLTLALIFLQTVLGGAVSGLDGGQVYNTFPLMEGVFVPEGVWANPVWFRNLFEDATTAQFVHRILSYALCILIPLFWLVENKNPHIAHLLPILFCLFVVQFLLGVLTLLFAVPLPLASLHQANVILMFLISVTIVHRLFIPIKTISYYIKML